MITISIVAVYFGIGVIAAFAVAKSARAFCVMVALWPFLLPTSFLAPNEARSSAVAETGARRKLAETRETLRAAWLRSGRVEDRERLVVDEFLDRLDEKAARLDELRLALVATAPSVRPRLEKLRDEAELEIDQGIVLLEEMTAQLTLLRFANLPGGASDRDGVEALVAKIEALATI